VGGKAAQIDAGDGGVGIDQVLQVDQDGFGLGPGGIGQVLQVDQGGSALSLVGLPPVDLLGNGKEVMVRQ